MEIYLLRHGLALPDTEDPEESLSRRGVEQIQAAAAAMKKMGIAPDLIVCSPKRRARQTAALIAEKLNYPYSDLLETATVQPTAPPTDALAFLRGHSTSRSVLVAGHLPSLPALASLLLGAAAPLNLHFDNGSLCRVDAPHPAPGQGELAFHLPSALLRLIAGS